MKLAINKMSNVNKCRICLLDGAKIPIFDDVESKESVHSKLFQCFKEKIEDIEGYPQNICESCNDTLHTVYNFIKTYKESCELLESSLSIKKEICDDNDSDSNDVDLCKDGLVELTICKKEPDFDYIESLDDTLWDIPLQNNNKQDKQYDSLTLIKAKLKSLKEINFKRKCAGKTTQGTGKVASSILEAEYEWNEERWCFKSNILKNPTKRREIKPKKRSEENLKGQWKHEKPKLPKQTTVPEAPPPSLCDICGEVFKTFSFMIHHKKNEHLFKKVKCPNCPKSSRVYTKHNFHRHMIRIHSEKVFICDTCGRGFALKGLMTAHIRITHGNIKKKRYVCKKCSKDFANTKSLTIHERSAHTGLRPVQCPECGARFYHEDYLKEHMRLHTGETPYKCPICGRGYAQRGNMRSHVSHNHRLEDLTPEQIKNLKPNWFKYLKKP